MSIISEPARKEQLVHLIKIFEGLRGKSMDDQERLAFQHYFGNYGKGDTELETDNKITIPSLQVLQDLIEAVCTSKDRFTKVSDLIKEAGGGKKLQSHTQKRFNVKKGEELEQRVIEVLMKAFKEKYPNEEIGEYWIIFELSGLVEIAVLPGYDSWMLRFHDPMEKGWPIPGCSLRYCSLRGGCLSPYLFDFWNSVISEDSLPLIIKRPPEDPHGEIRAKNRTERYLTAGTLKADEL